MAFEGQEVGLLGSWFIENEDVGDVLKDRPAETLKRFIKTDGSTGLSQASIEVFGQRIGSHVEAKRCCTQCEVNFASIRRWYEVDPLCCKALNPK